MIGGPNRRRRPAPHPVAIILAMSRRAKVIRSRRMPSAWRLAIAASAKSSEFIGPSHDRSKIEAEGLLDIAGARLACVTLAIGTVAPKNEPGVDERCKMTAQRRGGHSVGA